MIIDNEVINKCWGLSKRIAYYITKNEADAEDIAQKSLIKLINYKENIIQNPEGWIRVVARNLSIEHLSETKKRTNKIKESTYIPTDCNGDLISVPTNFLPYILL